MLERKRDDLVRGAILQLHTSIEDILTSWIRNRILGIKSYELHRWRRRKPAQALRRVLSGGAGIGFESKLNLAVALGLIDGPTQIRLAELNRLRNRCSHNWLLKVPVRRGRKPREKKPALLLYRGRDLHRAEVLGDFASEYSLLYVRLWEQYIG